MSFFRIEGTATIQFSRAVEANDLDEAWDIADSMYPEDLEDDDLKWPPIGMDIDDVWDDD